MLLTNLNTPRDFFYVTCGRPQNKWAESSVFYFSWKFSAKGKQSWRSYFKLWNKNHIKRTEIFPRKGLQDKSVCHKIYSCFLLSSITLRRSGGGWQTWRVNVNIGNKVTMFYSHDLFALLSHVKFRHFTMSRTLFNLNINKYNSTAAGIHPGGNLRTFSPMSSCSL